MDRQIPVGTRVLQMSALMFLTQGESRMELNNLEILEGEALDSIAGGFNWACFGGGVALGAGIATFDPIAVIVGGSAVLAAC